VIDGDPLAGLLWIEEHGQKAITHVWVDPEVQGQGIGRALVDAYKKHVSRSVTLAGPFSDAGASFAKRIGGKIVETTESLPVEWDEDYGSIPAYARDFERARVPVSQIASPFINPISQERIDELAQLEDSGHTLPPIIVDGPHEVEEVDYPEEKYPFLDGHHPEVGEEFWYVHDGHHRVALAIERGARYVDALVMG
jgi:hypothetical protein